MVISQRTTRKIFVQQHGDVGRLVIRLTLTRNGAGLGSEEDAWERISPLTESCEGLFFFSVRIPICGAAHGSLPMDPAQQSPVLSGCCFAPAAWKNVLSSKRANQVAPVEMVASEHEFGMSFPSQSAGKAFQSADHPGLERVQASKTWGPGLPEQIVSGSGRGGVLGEECAPPRLTIEFEERGDGISPGRLHLGVSSTDCEPIPAGTPLWNALLHQSPSREVIRMPRPENSSCTAGHEDLIELGGPSRQLSTAGKASVVVSNSPSRLRICVPLDPHSAAVHIHTASEGEPRSSCAGVMSRGGAVGCLQCAASAGALDAMRKYWEQAEQRAREAEAVASRVGRNERRLTAQLAALLKQVGAGL